MILIMYNAIITKKNRAFSRREDLGLNKSSVINITEGAHLVVFTIFCKKLSKNRNSSCEKEKKIRMIPICRLDIFGGREMLLIAVEHLRKEGNKKQHKGKKKALSLGYIKH